MTGEVPLSDQAPERPNRPGPEALYGVKDLTEDTAQRLVRAIEGSRPLRTLRGSQVATGIVGSLGLALFLVGLENAVADVPIVENGWTSMLVGLVFLAAAGVLIRRFME